MIAFSGRGVLLDIEGTTTSIDFVYKALFPYARRELEPFLRAHGQEAEVRAACAKIALEAGFGPEAPGQGQLVAEVVRLMDQDAKTTGLKELQGLIWRVGYASSALRAHVFSDVPPCLSRFRRAGLDVRIYSSGSALAQKLLFSHTEHGDLTGLLSGYYDTTVGPKRHAESYRAIAADMECPTGEVLFLSDVPAELDAARAAGMQTALVCRPGNAPVPSTPSHAAVSDFFEIEVSPRA